MSSKKGASAYTLKLPSTWHIHPTFNESLLTPYTPPAFPNQEQPLPPPPDLIDGEEHYEIEKVLDSRERKVRGRTGEPWRWTTDYFVKWKGYGPESNTWVRENDMDADELIDDYLAEHVDMVSGKKEDWEYHTDPRTGKKLRSWDELTNFGTYLADMMTLQQTLNCSWNRRAYLNSSQDACLNKGVMSRFIYFSYLSASYLILSSALTIILSYL